MSEGSTTTQRMAAIAKAVAASAPNPDRPRMADEYERKLNESDRARAVCYASLEEVTDRLKEVADELSDESSESPVPIEIEADEETSLVTAIADLRQNTQ